MDGPAETIPISVSPLLPASTPTPSPFPRPCYYEITILRIDDNSNSWSPTSSPSASSPSHPSNPSPSPPPSLLKRLKPTLDCIKFKNYFVGAVTIQQMQKRKSSPPPPSTSSSPTSPAVATVSDHWQTVLQSRPLMSNVHCEREAQINHTITISEFDPNHYESGSDAPLRIYIEQPSPLWKTYSLENITFIGSVTGKRRRSSQAKSSSSAWPPVGSAGASLMRNVSHLNSPSRDNSDLWNTNPSPPYTSDQSSLPGSTLDRLSRAISAQMSLIRSTDILDKSQASAFLAVDVDTPPVNERPTTAPAEPAPTTSRRASSARRSGGWR